MLITSINFLLYSSITLSNHIVSIKKSGEVFGFFYLHNKKAWMTDLFFQEYLKCINAHINRKVLLIDNAPNHILKDRNLPNIEILSLPKNMISKLQSLDARIIVSFSRHYRRHQFEQKQCKLWKQNRELEKSKIRLNY